MWKLIIFRYFSQFGNLMVELYQIRMKKLQNHNINIEFNCDFPSLWPSFTILWEYFRNLHQKLTCLSEGINESCKCKHCLAYQYNFIILSMLSDTRVEHFLGWSIFIINASSLHRVHVGKLRMEMCNLTILFLVSLVLIKDYPIKMIMNCFNNFLICHNYHLWVTSN